MFIHLRESLFVTHETYLEVNLNYKQFYVLSMSDSERYYLVRLIRWVLLSRGEYKTQKELKRRLCKRVMIIVRKIWYSGSLLDSVRY